MPRLQLVLPQSVCAPFLRMARLAAFPLLLLIWPLDVSADILHGLATMGDSSSIKSQPYKFPVMLQNHRGLNFGGPTLPYVRAVGGSTTASVLTGQQPEKVAQDVEDGKVTVTTFLIGTNDYGQDPLAMLTTLLNPAQLEVFESTMIDNITTAATTVLNSGIEGFLLGSVPRILNVPALAPYIPLAPQELLDMVDASQQRVNAALLDFANQNHIPFVDFWGFQYSLGDADHIVIGGVNINVGKGTTPDFFFVDNLHPGWIGNAIISNMWMEALNIAYGTNLIPFSDQEMLSMAGLSGYTGETFSTAVNYADFIYFNPVPEPNTAVLCVLGGAVLALAGTRKTRRQRVPA